MDVPPVAVVVQARDVVVRGHEVQVHDTFRPRSYPGDRFQQDAGCLLLEQEGWGPVTADLRIVQWLVDELRGPPEFGRPALDRLDQRTQQFHPGSEKRDTLLRVPGERLDR